MARLGPIMLSVFQTDILGLQFIGMLVHYAKLAENCRRHVNVAGEVSQKTDVMIGTSLAHAQANADPKDSFGEDSRQPREDKNSPYREPSEEEGERHF